MLRAVPLYTSSLLYSNWMALLSLHRMSRLPPPRLLNIDSLALIINPFFLFKIGHIWRPKVPSTAVGSHVIQSAIIPHFAFIPAWCPIISTLPRPRSNSTSNCKKKLNRKYSLHHILHWSDLNSSKKLLFNINEKRLKKPPRTATRPCSNSSASLRIQTTTRTIIEHGLVSRYKRWELGPYLQLTRM
jgi:hypothetical protein